MSTKPCYPPPHPTKVKAMTDNRLADEAAYFGAVQDGVDSQQEIIESLRQQLANEQAHIKQLETGLDKAITQLEELKVNHKAELVMRDQNSQMYLDNVRQELAEWTNFFSEWDSPGEVHESLIGLQKDVNALHRQLVESQTKLVECLAREKVLRDELDRIANDLDVVEDSIDPDKWPAAVARLALAMPSDSTALDLAIKQAKQEALLGAMTWFEESVYGVHYFGEPEDELRRMAKELE